MKKERVLFVCTHNSSRSQMAEGLLRALHGDRFEVYSAGTEPSQVNPFAVKAMDEIGIDITRHTSQHVDEVIELPMTYVITVCDSAREQCPYIPAEKKNIHQRFEDPSAVESTDRDKLAAFRRIRDEIKTWIEASLVEEMR